RPRAPLTRVLPQRQARLEHRPVGPSRPPLEVRAEPNPLHSPSPRSRSCSAPPTAGNQRTCALSPAPPRERRGYLRTAKLQLTAVLAPGDKVPGLYLHPDHRRRLRRDPVRSDLNV